MYTCGRDSGSCHTVTTDCNITADFTCTRHYVPPVGLAAADSVSVPLLWQCCTSVAVLWHSFLPPAFFSGRSLGTSWAWRQPLTLVRCICICVFSDIGLCTCSCAPFSDFPCSVDTVERALSWLWNQPLTQSDSTTWLQMQEITFIYWQPFGLFSKGVVERENWKCQLTLAQTTHWVWLTSGCRQLGESNWETGWVEQISSR